MKNELTIKVGSISGGEVTFIVTRPEPGTDRDPVAWVTVADGEQTPEEGDDLPVIWGRNFNLSGTSGPFNVTGPEAIAYATYTPWRPKRNDPNISFTVE